MGYMFLPWKRYFDFSGRSRRMEFWMFVLLSAVFGAIFGAFVGGSMGWAASHNMEPTAGFWILCVLFYLLIFVLFGIPGIALGVRRLHDQDKSGWLYLLNFVPIANFYILFLMFMPGTVGPNQYGPDPKQVPIV